MHAGTFSQPVHFIFIDKNVITEFTFLFFFFLPKALSRAPHLNLPVFSPPPAVLAGPVAPSSACTHSSRLTPSRLSSYQVLGSEGHKTITGIIHITTLEQGKLGVMLDSYDHIFSNKVFMQLWKIGCKSYIFYLFF